MGASAAWTTGREQEKNWKRTGKKEEKNKVAQVAPLFSQCLRKVAAQQRFQIILVHLKFLCNDLQVPGTSTQHAFHRRLDQLDSQQPWMAAWQNVSRHSQYVNKICQQEMSRDVKKSLCEDARRTLTFVAVLRSSPRKAPLHSHGPHKAQDLFVL